MTDKAILYKEKSRKYFDKQSIDYFRTFDGKYCNQMYEEVMKRIQMHSFRSILDLGCGTGALLSRVVNQCQGVQACGLDLSEKMLEQAVALLTGKAQLVAGDSDNLPWENESFDLVVCNASFHHFPEPLKVLEEIRRVLKANGRVLIADPWWSRQKRFLINLFLSSSFNFLGDVRVYSEQEFHLLLTGCGFKFVSWELIANTYSITSAIAGK